MSDERGSGGQPVDETQPLPRTSGTDETQPLGTTPTAHAGGTTHSTEDLMDTDRVTDTPVTGTPSPDTGGTAGGTYRADDPLAGFGETRSDASADAARTATEAGAAGTTTSTGRPGVRVGTVVWGLVIAAVGIGLLAFASGVVFDVQLAFILLVAAAGLALLVGSVATGLRRRGR